MLPKITKVEALENYQLHIYLDDGFDFLFDFTPCLSYTCNKALHDINLFKRAKFYLRMIYWDDMHDIHLDRFLNHICKI